MHGVHWRACANLCTRPEMYSNDVAKSIRADGSKRAIRKGGYPLEADTGAPRVELAQSRRAEPAACGEETESGLFHFARLAEQYRKRNVHSKRLQAVHVGGNLQRALVQHLLGVWLQPGRIWQGPGHVCAFEDATGYAGP